MADKVERAQTTLQSEEVIVRAVQYFSTARWRATSQSARTATFEGKPRIPWFWLLLTLIGFMACVVPGVLLYIFVIQKMNRFQNLVVSVTPIPPGSEVTVQFPPEASVLVRGFLTALPTTQPEVAR